MAGLAKPDSINGKEVNISIGTCVVEFSAGSSLIDGVIGGVPLLINTDGYITFTVTEKCDIYAILTQTYSDSGGTFGANVHLSKLVNSIYQHIGTYPTTNGSSATWYKLFPNLDAGTYKVTPDRRYVGFNEWFAEGKELCLIKYNNRYFSINPVNYDIYARVYIPLQTIDFDKHMFNIADLFTEVSINGETFKPIDKFNNFKIITNKPDFNLNLQGLKYTKQLIVASDDIPSSIANNIDSFTLTSTKTIDALIKMALSIDKGLTWKTYNPTTSAFEDLTTTIIPLKVYETLNADELTQWNNAIETISTNGITPEQLNTLDFNPLNADYIRFAYVLSRPTYSDTAQTSQLDWQFDAKGSMRKMTDSEHYVDVYEHDIKITTLIKTPLIKVNVIV